MPNVRPSARLVARFSSRLIAHDFPRLPDSRRDETVAYATRRVVGMPGPMAMAVAIVAVAVDGLTRVGADRAVGFLARRPMPVVGEYVRLVRSLVTAYVWDTWPSTLPDGGVGGR